MVHPQTNASCGKRPCNSADNKIELFDNKLMHSRIYCDQTDANLLFSSLRVAK